MARQFKIEISYADGTHADIYWLDNADIEIIQLPPISTEDRQIARLSLWRTIAEYSKSNSVTKVECTREP